MRAAHPVRSTEAARTRPNRRFIDTLDPPIYLSIIVPTYEYQCEKCQRVFEIRQRITEPALTICEVCGGHVKRLLSPAPFILKGEGSRETRRQWLGQGLGQGFGQGHGGQELGRQARGEGRRRRVVDLERLERYGRRRTLRTGE